MGHDSFIWDMTHHPDIVQKQKAYLQDMDMPQVADLFVLFLEMSYESCSRCMCTYAAAV